MTWNGVYDIFSRVDVWSCGDEMTAHDNDTELTFVCGVCGERHNTDAGDRMDALYADVLPMRPYFPFLARFYFSFAASTGGDMAFEWVTPDSEARLAQAFFEARITPQSYYAVGMRPHMWAAKHHSSDKEALFRKYSDAGFFVINAERLQRDDGSYIVMIYFRIPMRFLKNGITE